MNKFMHGLPKDLYKGMRVRPSMEQIVNYIEKDPYKIKYPDRDATFYLNSPQFLNLMNDSGLDLDEQSKNQAKHQLAQAQAVAEGRGGVVDRAINTGVDVVDEGRQHTAGVSSAEAGTSTSRDQRFLRRRVGVSLLNTLQKEIRRQESQRQATADLFSRQREAELQALREQRLAQQQIAAQTVARTTAHPFAAAAAAAASSSSPTSPTLDVAQEMPVSMFPQSLQLATTSDVGMSTGAQVKRAAEGDANGSPKAKARPAGATGRPPPLPPPGSVTLSQGAPVKSKARESVQDIDKMRDELRLLLRSSSYNNDEIRTKFKEKFPAATQIVSVSKGGIDVMVDNAPRNDIISEFIDRLKTKQALSTFLRDLKEEVRRRESASGAESATVSLSPEHKTKTVTELREQLREILDEKLDENDIRTLFRTKFKTGDSIHLSGYPKPLKIWSAHKIQIITEWLGREKTHKELADTISKLEEFITNGKNPFTSVADPPMAASSSGSASGSAPAMKRKK